ncbi:MAG TPA: Rrf2 family transcriptional regulator [Acidimicrobiales bacterium]|nr:Rrf2 family transcriptional regulator [Acidimicrobiales bacterium]
MRTTAKVDYAVRAVVALARAAATAEGGRPEPVKAHALAAQGSIPPKFLESILADLKRAEVVASQRGAVGGYRLARPADEVTVADVIRAVEGPLADVRGERPETLAYPGDLASLQRMWIAVRANLRAVLEHTTVADLAAGKLAPEVDALADDDDAWDPH